MSPLTRRNFTRFALTALPAAGLLSAGNPLLAGVPARPRAAQGPGRPGELSWDPFDYGARGDGIAPDTRALQAAIDACHAAGGGRVSLRPGRFLSGTLYLKNNVSLHLEAGATLVGSGDPTDYPRTPTKHPGYDGEMLTGRALIYAESATGIGLGGRGTIDGSGHRFDRDEKGGGANPGPSFNWRPRIIHFVRCENIRVRDVQLVNSGSWVQCYDQCRDVVFDGITVNSVKGHNMDGMDLIDCERVRVANCSITCGDDAICLKSLDPAAGCRDIAISNCVLSTRCYAFKIGTETSGAFQNIVMQGCSVYDCREAIGIQTVDGARVENVVIANLVLRNVWAAAIAIRHGARDRTYRKGAALNQSVLRGVIIQNIVGIVIGKTGSSIAGVQDRLVEDVLLRDIHLTCVGGGTAEDAARPVQELRNKYPKSQMFGVLPAHGFYLRHTRGVRLEGVHLHLTEDDARPAIVAEDSADLEVHGLKTSPRMKAAQAVVRNTLRSKP